MSSLVVDHPQFDYVVEASPDTEPAQLGQCHVRIFAQGGGDVVLLVTHPSGESATTGMAHAIAMIVTTAVRRFALDPERLTVVEHADDRWTRDTGIGRCGRTPDATGDWAPSERFGIVTFSHVPASAASAAIAAIRAKEQRDADLLQGDTFAGPDSRQVTKRQVEALVGQALP